MGIVEYSLWDTSGTVEIRSGHKVGFCLRDMLDRPDLHPDPGPLRYESNCQAARPWAPTLHMCVSQGRQAGYGFATTFQWIHVSDVLPGHYRVGQRADPDNVVLESNGANNGLALSQQVSVVPGYVARPQSVRVEPDAAARFELTADGYSDGEGPGARAHRIVSQPSSGRLDVGDTFAVIGAGGATHQAFRDTLVTSTPDPGFVGVDSFTFVAFDESRPQYPVNPAVATVTLDVTGLVAAVSIDNAPAWLAPGSSVDLDATVDGSASDVDWSVDGAGHGNATVGVIDLDGRYRAPTVPPDSGTVTIRAASPRAPSQFAEAQIAIADACTPPSARARPHTDHAIARRPREPQPRANPSSVAT